MRNCKLGVLLVAVAGLALLATRAPSDVFRKDTPTTAPGEAQARERRNAVLGSVLTKDSLIVLTRDGNLRKHDLKNLDLVQERACSDPYLCIAEGLDGSIVAASELGVLDEIDPATLKSKRLAQLPGRPMWIGADRTGKTLIAALGEITEENENAIGVAPKAIWDVNAKKGYPLKEMSDRESGISWCCSMSFAIDAKRQFYIACEKGEFGGWCQVLDLQTGKTQDRKSVV
jgi:hypothetical protein